MDDAAYRLENFVKPSLQRIEGVGNVEIYGTQAREVQIELLDDRLRSATASTSAPCSGCCATRTSPSPAATSSTAAARSTSARWAASTPSKIISSHHRRSTVRRLRLSDVALVRFRPPRREWVYRVDRQPAIGIQVTRDSTGNIERISREVRRYPRRPPEKLPAAQAGVHFNIFFDQGIQVKQSIDNLADSGLWGGIFAALVIYIFLRAPRMTGDPHALDPALTALHHHRPLFHRLVAQRRHDDGPPPRRRHGRG